MEKIKWAIIAVFSALSITAKAQYLPLTAGTGSPLTGILITNVYNANQIALNNNGNNYGFIINPSPAKWSLGYGTTPSTLGTSVLTWNDSGNVGIGTTSPTNKLDIQGGNASIHNTGSTSSLVIGSSATGKTYVGISTSADAGGYGVLQSISASGSTYGNTVINPTAGKVGIGTTTPDELLSVAGTIHSKEVRVELSGLPDYVFKSTYKLPTLTEVKTYIDKNQHLPEMPSAAEVEKNGLNLGEMNKLLLKKVEELTLYLIEENKQKRIQQKEINALKGQMKTLIKKH